MSEQNQTEEALRESEQKFRALFQGIPVPVYAWQQRGEDFVLIDHNEAADAITGGTMGDFLGTSVSAMYPDRPDIVDDISRCFAEKVSFQREMAYSFKSTGGKKVLVVKYAFVPPDLVLVHTEDITERKLAEEEASYQRDLLQTLLDNMPDYVYFKDINRRFVLASNSFTDLFNLSLEEIIGKTDEELFPPEIAVESVKDDRHVIETGTPLIDKEEGGELIGGEEPWVLTTKLPWYDKEGNIIGLFGISKDITDHKKGEQVLRESEEKFRLIAETSIDTIYQLDTEGNILFMNTAGAGMIGYEPEEMEGLNFVDLLTKDHLAEGQEHVRRVLSGESVQGEIYMKRKDGHEFPLYFSMVPVEKDGQIVGFSGISRDITELKRTEDVLRYQAHLLKNVSDAIVSTEMDFAIRSWNQAAEEIYGWHADEVIGKPVSDVLQPDWPDGQREEVIEQLFADGQWEVEAVHRHKNGTPINVLVSAALLKDDEGNPTGVVSAIRDVTERAQAEQALRESYSRLNNILESAMDAIITVNEDQLLVMVNPAAERMFGFEGKKVVGRPLNELMPARFREKHNDLIRSFGQTNVTARNMGNMGTLWGRRANGEEFPIEVSISQVNLSGEKLYTAIIRDITERKLLEGQIQESATLEERNRIARELHDSVTQSLYSINLQSDATIMALSSGRVEDAEKRLQTLKDIAQESMSEMRLLIYELHPSILEEAGLVAALRQRLETVESRSGIQVDLQVEGEQRLPISLEKELYQISLEGLNNVLKHSKANEVLVGLSFEHDRCRLMIQDDGVGFALARSDRFGGYGLANIKDRLEQIGGELTIISEPGKGTTLDIEVIL